jgi:hypothetical protein
MNEKYQAGGNAYFYPKAGDELPLRGAKVILLTKGGIATIGAWNAAFCIGWAPLPKRDKAKEDANT